MSKFLDLRVDLSFKFYEQIFGLKSESRFKDYKQIYEQTFGHKIRSSPEDYEQI